jgi:hypothetical protein
MVQHSAAPKQRIDMKAYEIHNPDFNDMNLEQQIAAGCCDWCVEGFSGHLYYGHTARAAEQNAALYFYA